jgi:uncharacterized protein
MLIGENNANTPIQQALLLNLKLDEKGHRSHELKTYPGLGHAFYLSQNGRLVLVLYNQTS